MKSREMEAGCINIFCTGNGWQAMCVLCKMMLCTKLSVLYAKLAVLSLTLQIDLMHMKLVAVCHVCY